MALNKGGLNFAASRKPIFETKLNLVSLMDIFTILVFFLLLNSGDANQFENATFIKLPDSSATASPHVEAAILVSKDDIRLNNEMVIKMDELKSSTDNVIQPLSDALNDYLLKKGEASEYEKDNGFAVTILGDRSVSYQLLERVMTTCSLANFRDISLAVNRVATPTIMFQQQATNEMATNMVVTGSTVKTSGVGE